MKPQLKHYDRISRANHWIAALLIIGLLASGVALDQFLEGHAMQGAVRNMHKAVGLIALGFGLWRVVWRLKQGFVAPLQQDWQGQAAHWTHVILLVAIVAMPVSGVMMSYFAGYPISFFGLFTIPGGPKVAMLNELAGSVHAVMGKVMIVTLLLHIAGAIKHVVVDRDDTMARMTKGA